MSLVPIHGGKGSRKRPVADQKKFNSNWDKAFGKKESQNDLDDKSK